MQRAKVDSQCRLIDAALSRRRQSGSLATSAGVRLNVASRRPVAAECRQGVFIDLLVVG